MSTEHLTPELLVALSDGELHGAERAAAGRHVAACAACADELDLYRRTGDLVAALARVSGPPDLAERVLACARAEPSRSSSQLSSQPAAQPRAGALRRLPILRLAAAAAVLSAAVLGARQALTPRPAGDGAVELSASEEQAIARDLYLLHNLEALEQTDSDELKALVEDLDVLDSLMLEEQEG